MHGMLASVGCGGRLWRPFPQLCLPPPVQWAQSPVSAYTYLDVSCNPVVSAAVLCLLVPWRTGTRWPLALCPHPSGHKGGG